jgi:DNA polymerase-3 subunit alpha
MDKHFVHLHLHSEFSLLDGAIKIPDLLKFVKSQGWRAVGISDHGNVFSAVKFFQMAKKEGIKPILGVEMYFTPDAKVKDHKDKYYHIMLIVQNDQGYKNLCKLFSFAYQEGFYFKPRIDYAQLEKYHEGLIVTTACVGGHIPTLLRDGNIDEAEQRSKFLKDLLGDRFYFEIAPPDIEIARVTKELMVNYGQKWGIPLTVGCDAHFINKDDHEAHEVLLSIQTKDQLDNPDRFSFGDFLGYLRTEGDIAASFKDDLVAQEAMWTTGEIADRCEFQFEFGKLFFPKFPIPEQYTTESFFEHLCSVGLEKLKSKGLIPTDKFNQYEERLRLEIDLIEKMGFVGYFLVVSDFIQWGKRQGIPIGPGRGSAAGSLVAWTLEITNVDPLRFNLLFERFLNPERISMPDIDIDFCIERREEVINYVKEKYGHDCVCQIITFGTMMAKGVIKDVARVLGFPFQDANAITDLIPEQLKITLDEALQQEPRLKELIDANPKLQKLLEIAKKLEGLTRHASKHAAGVVISPSPLQETMPLYVPAKTDDLVSQYTMTDLEALGFLKMDFLGLKNLTVIDSALKAIKLNHGVDIDLDTLPLDDKLAFELLCKGNSNGIFQFESDGIKDVLRKLQPDKFEDLIAVNALYRPGPLGSGMVDDYIDRRHGRKQTTYMFAELEPVLGETYGVIVYQEQVMKIASAIAGYTLGGADILRKAMGKKKVEVMAQQRELFIKGATQKGFSEKKSGELFDLMAYFAGYGFNKSHSTAYALIAYHTAYLKSHYPHEFMASLITFETSNPDAFQLYLQEIHDMGLEMVPPNVNLSFAEFRASGGKIIFGLQGIKNVGGAALEGIILERVKKPFTDLLDFCKRVDLRTVNKRVIESLICAGAMDCLSGNRAQKMAELDKIIEIAHAHKEKEKTGQMDLFGLSVKSDSKVEELYSFQILDEWSDKEKLEKEKEVTGFYLSSHPLKSYKQLKWLKTDSFTGCLDKIKTVNSMKEPFATVVGFVQSKKEITTKKGDRMAFVELEDMSGHCEIVVFPSVFKKVSAWLDQYNVFVVSGAVDITSQNKCKIKANQMVPIELIFDNYDSLRGLTLGVASVVQKEQMDKIKTNLSAGTVPLKISFTENNQKLTIFTRQKVSCSLDKLLKIQTECDVSIAIEL